MTRAAFAFLALLTAAASYALPPVGAIMVAAILVYLWGLHNRLAPLKQAVLQARSNIDTELTRRRDLFDRLFAVVAANVNAETTLMRDVSRIRSEGRQAGDGEIARGMSMLNAVAEANPEVRFSENYIALQHEIAATESAIQQARETYNEAVRAYNTVITMFPNNVMALPLPFRVEHYYTP